MEVEGGILQIEIFVADCPDDVEFNRQEINFKIVGSYILVITAVFFCFKPPRLSWANLRFSCVVMHNLIAFTTSIKSNAYTWMWDNQLALCASQYS